MKGAILTVLVLGAVTFAGCLGSSDTSFDYVPGEDYVETGRTVHLKATVLDLL